MRKTIQDHALEAADAKAALFVMACVASLLDGGTVAGGAMGCGRSAQRIIAIAKSEQRRQLARMDKAADAIIKATGAAS